MNYAEAANEAWGPKADPLGLGKTAETMLKELRKRAGIDSADPYLGEMASAGKDEFRQLVQNERRIELCFENHRFFDVRRWMLPLEVINTPVKGVTIQKTVTSLHMILTGLLKREIIEIICIMVPFLKRK